MYIRLQPDQIPRFWEVIKFVFIKTGDYQKENFPTYFRKLLIDLLSSKSQCFISMDDERGLLGMLLSYITKDDVTDEKTLFISSLYSFKFATEDEWIRRFKFVKDMAFKDGCKLIITNSSINRVFDLVKQIGFEERFRCFALRTDGGK